MSNDLTKTKPRLFLQIEYIQQTILIVATMQTSANANFLSKWDFFDSYQPNPMSNDLTKTKPRLFYEMNIQGDLLITDKYVDLS